MTKIITNKNTIMKAKLSAFPYQTQAFLTLKDMDYCAIFHEQGLGKTKIAIDLLLYWLTKREIDTVLIVTKKQLVQNWMDEFSIHTYIRPKVLSNNRKDNFYVFNSPSKVVITNFETILTEKNRIKLWLKTRDVAVIIDESTKIKNPDSKLTKNFFDIAKLFKIRAIMTGTPVANRPYDIWSQIYFLDGGKSLGNDFLKFKQNTDLKNNFEYDNDRRSQFEKTVSTIYSKIASFSVRETKRTASIELPQKIYKTVKTKFAPIQMRMYKKIIKDLKLEIRKENFSIIDDEKTALKRLIRLNQVTSNPYLIDDDYKEKSAKEILLSDILSNIVSRGEKCIVWSNYIKNINIFCDRYKEYAPQKIHGLLDIKSRNQSINIFKNDRNCKVLFATPQSAKEGLTLTVANNVIFYDRSFNLDDYLQAQDRIHRISQKKTCYIYNLLVEGSIDEWIDKLLDAKQYAAFLAQGDINLSEYKSEVDYSYGSIIKEILQYEDRDDKND